MQVSSRMVCGMCDGLAEHGERAERTLGRAPEPYARCVIGIPDLVPANERQFL